MLAPKRIVVALVCWSSLNLAALAQNVPPTETDRLRTEVTELRQLVSELTQRIQTLERQLAESRPATSLRLVDFAEPVHEDAEAAPRLLPSVEKEPLPVRQFQGSGTEEGMRIDALEHRQRWERAIQALPGLETR